jgi:hypothetical protein
VNAVMTFGFHKIQGIPWLAEDWFVCQGLCSMELLTLLVLFYVLLFVAIILCREFSWFHCCCFTYQNGTQKCDFHYHDSWPLNPISIHFHPVPILIATFNPRQSSTHHHNQFQSHTYAPPISNHYTCSQPISTHFSPIHVLCQFQPSSFQ